MSISSGFDRRTADVRQQHDIVACQERGMNGRFVLKDVEASRGDLPRAPRLCERSFVDDRSARGIDQNGRRLICARSAALVR